jgi:thioredoxin 1
MAERWNTENFEEKVLKETRPVLVDFYSDSCVPCKRMSPVVAELEEEFAGAVAVGKVNIAYDTELTERYEVSSAPTFLVFKNGEIAARAVGAQKKADLKALLEQHL